MTPWVKRVQVLGSKVLVPMDTEYTDQTLVYQGNDMSIEALLIPWCEKSGYERPFDKGGIVWRKSSSFGTIGFSLPRFLRGKTLAICTFFFHHRFIVRGKIN